MTTTDTITRAELYWDDADPMNEGWAYRLHFADGREESAAYGTAWCCLTNAELPAAMVYILREFGVFIAEGDVAVEDRDGGYAIYTAKEAANA
jgi:hypothetical protein